MNIDDALFSGLGLGLILAFFSYIIILYVVQAYSLHTLATNRGNDKGWLAWVPIANSFVIPLLVEDDVAEPLRGRFTLIYGITIVLSMIPFLGILFSIVSVALAFYGFFVLVNQYSNNTVIHIILSIVTGGLWMVITLFRIRNREYIGQ